MAKSQKSSGSKAITQTEAAQPDRNTRNAATGSNFIRSWRLMRHISSQSALARLTKQHHPSGTGITRETICRLESGEAPYRQDHIEILGRTLSVHPRDLIGTDPANAGDIFAVYAGMSAAEKRDLLKAARRIKR